jgi:hypothetical protein
VISILPFALCLLPFDFAHHSRPSSVVHRSSFIVHRFFFASFAVISILPFALCLLPFDFALLLSS